LGRNILICRLYYADKPYMENSDKQQDRERAPGPKLLAGYLASALNMEDEISNGIYADYLDPKNWPEGIAPEVFKQITDRLTVLIDDTKKHKKIIEALAKKHGQNQR
jgi:hypothetical protein